MKILFQTFTSEGGGLSNVVMLLRAYSRQFSDDHIDILCRGGEALRKMDDLPNVSVFSYGKAIKEIDRLFVGWHKIGRVAKALKSDITWSLNLGAYKNIGIPQVLSVHNSYQVYPLDIAGMHPENKFYVAVLRYFFRKSLKASDAIIVQTHLMKEYVKKTSGAPAFVSAIPKAVETSEDVDNKPLPSSLRDALQNGNAFTFLYVSTFKPHKNHDTLLKAFSLLSAEKSTARLVLTVDPDDLVKRCGEMARHLIREGRVVPAGWIDKHCLKNLYDECDACLMPSLLESLSSAHLEAMMWGKPQIVSDLPFSRDVCGNAAFYSSCSDPEDWADKIVEFMSDEMLRKKLVKNGFERMKRYPKSWTEVASKVREVFTNALHDKGRRRLDA